MTVSPCKCVQKRIRWYTVVMPKIMGWKCIAKTRTATVNALVAQGAGAQRARVTRHIVQVIIHVN